MIGKSIGEMITYFDKPTSLRAINVVNGNFVYAYNENKSIDSKQLSYSAEILNSFNYDLNLKKFQKELKLKTDHYYLIDLGYISNSWDTEMYENYTDLIKTYHNHENLLGFILSYKNNNIEVLPFLKAVIRDLKKFMAARDWRMVNIGIAIDESYQLDPTSLKYLTCDFNQGNQSYMFDFYLNKGRNSIDNNTTTTTFELEPVNKTLILNNETNNECPKQDGLVWGLHPKNLPHTPRRIRCSCLFTTLEYIGNSSYLIEKKFKEEDPRIEEIINNLCNIVYCSTLEVDLSLGHYGMLSTCSKFQKLSFVMNWFFTIYPEIYDHKNDKLTSEKLTNLGIDPNLVIRTGNHPNITIREQMLSIMTDNKSSQACKNEIIGDWKLYAKGRKLSEMVDNLFEEEQVNDDIEFQNNRFKLQNKASKLVKISFDILLLLLTSFIFSII